MIQVIAFLFYDLRNSLAALLPVTLLGLLSNHALALDTQVLSNFNQPSSGYYYRLGVRDLMAIPFTTDASFTELDGAELPVQTWYGSGGLQVSIWSANGIFQPASQPACFTVWPLKSNGICCLHGRGITDRQHLIFFGIECH